MRSDLKLSLDDLQVSTFAPEADGTYASMLAVTGRIGCVSVGRVCVTKEFGGGDTCESGPYYYC
jgi:hypothetical protein